MIQVGDKVKVDRKPYNGWEGTVLLIHKNLLWVEFDQPFLYHTVSLGEIAIRELWVLESEVTLCLLEL